MMQWEGWNRAIPIPEIRERDKEFQEKYKLPIDVYAAWWYSCAYALAKATDTAKTVDKKSVRDALAKVYMKGGEKGNLNFFPLMFDENGQTPQVSVFTQWIKGKMEILYPEMVKTADPIFPAPPWSERK
jgi:branched-chain amino acid transport system substrate-binding protein